MGLFCFPFLARMRLTLKVLRADMALLKKVNQAHPRQKGEAEQAHPPVDQDEDREHHPVQRQEEALEEDQAEALGSTSTSSPESRSHCSHSMKRVMANLHCCELPNWTNKRGSG